MAKAKQTEGKPWERLGLTKSTYYRRKKARQLKRKPPAPSRKTRRVPGDDVLERTPRQADNAYRARHAAGLTTVEPVGPKMLTVSQDALAQMAASLADEAISKHHAEASRRWLDYILMGKADESIVTMTGTVRQFRAVRDALLKAGY